MLQQSGVVYLCVLLMAGQPMRHVERREEPCAAIVTTPPEPSLQSRGKSPIMISPAAAISSWGLWITRAYALSGSCLSKVEAYDFDRLLLAGGTALKVPSSGGVLTPTKGPLSQPPSPRQPARLDQALPKTTALVDRAGEKGGDRYIGIWPHKRGSVLASFIDGRDAQPKVIATINGNVEEITYFPAPDTAAGSIGLLIRQGSDWSAVSLTWQHRDWDWSPR